MKAFILLLPAIFLAAATPLEGTWKLNRSKSTPGAEPPSFVKNESMSFPAGGPVTPAVPPYSFVAVDGNNHRMYRIDISPDQRVLTVTRVQSYEDQSGRQFHTVFVLEK